jgi:hypothetical protein
MVRLAHTLGCVVPFACCFSGMTQTPGFAGTQAATRPEQATAQTELEARQIGKRLVQRAHSGALLLVNPERDGLQLRQIAQIGACLDKNGQPVTIAPALLKMLDRLSARSTPKKPLRLMSLYRQPTTKVSQEPHANGMAADIAEFGGHVIDSRNLKACVPGVIAILQALGPGEYRIGLPKPPNTDPHPYAWPPRRPPTWPFFPAPLPVTTRRFGIPLVLPAPNKKAADHSSAGAVRDKPLIARWENGRGAPLEEVGDAGVRAAIRDAQKRGANIYSLFPDALDHLHVDVRPIPGSDTAVKPKAVSKGPAKKPSLKVKPNRKKTPVRPKRGRS